MSRRLRVVAGMCVAVFGLLAVWPGEVKAGEGTPYSMQETFDYQVKYGPAHLADLRVDIGCRSGTDGRVRATLRASSRGMAKRVHPFRVRLDTETSTNSSRAVRAQTWIREQGEVRRYRSRFDDSPRVRTEADIYGSGATDTAPLPDTGHDLLSWMLDLRDAIAEEGPRQNPRRYPLWDGWKLVWLEVTPSQPTRLETPAGWMDVQPFELHRTEIHHEGSDQFEPKDDTEHLGTIWIEVTDRALPVAMDFDAPIGRVKIELTDFDRTDC